MSVVRAVAVCALLGAATSHDFCALDNLPQPAADVNHLRFSKELSQTEFASAGNFKSLHCCASAFRTVEWFKDGLPYPWTGDVSSLIINPASHNQTIYTRAVNMADSGSYHCHISNDTHQLTHRVHLTVTNSGFVGPPKATYSPREQYHNVGDTARFYCEAYVGSIQLPDARSEVVWSRHPDNFTADYQPNHSQRIVQREENRVLGAYLIIENIQKDDFGDYYCTVSNTGDQFLQLATHLMRSNNDEEWSNTDTTLRLCLGASFTLISVIIIVVTTYRCRLRLRLLIKLCRETLQTNDDDDVDVTLLYHENDAVTALNYIAPTLQQKYSYSCYSIQIHTQHQLGKPVISSKRLLAIVTPNVTENIWTAGSVRKVLQYYLMLHPRVICIFLQELPAVDIKTEDGRGLKETLSRIHYITHTEVHDNNFWTILQLGMPLPSKARSRKSRESLENLM